MYGKVLSHISHQENEDYTFDGAPWHTMKMAKTKKTRDSTRYWQGCDDWIALLVGVKSDTTTLENYLAISTKAEHTVYYDPAILYLLCIPNRNAHTCAPKDMPKHLHSSINIITQTVNNPNAHSSRIEWIQKLWNCHKRAYYMSVEMNRLLLHSISCNHLSERSHTVWF